VRKDFEGRVPKTPDEFAAAWKRSETYRSLIADIERYDRDNAIGGPKAEAFSAAVRAQQAKGARKKSPYTLTYGQQVGLCASAIEVHASAPDDPIDRSQPRFPAAHRVRIVCLPSAQESSSTGTGTRRSHLPKSAARVPCVRSS
jgi:hypothetical protein